MSTNSKISLFAAHGKNTRVIGRGLHLVWRISDDLKRFKALTTGHPIIMGRKTYDSIGRALPNRTNIIITRNGNFRVEGCVIVGSLEEAIEVAKNSPGSEEIFVIGGGEIYTAALPIADKLYLTLVDSEDQGDIFFPEWKDEFGTVVFEEDRHDDKSGLNYTWIDVER